MFERLRTSFESKGAVQTHFLLQKLYEVELRLHDHTNVSLFKSDPLAVIRAKPEEMISRSSHMWDLAERFIRAKIHERFGLDFIQYINLPIPDANLLNVLSFEVIANVEIEERKREQEIQRNAMAAAANEANNHKGPSQR